MSLSSSPLISVAKARQLRRQNATLSHQCVAEMDESASLLMDMSIGNVKGFVGQRSSKKRKSIDESDLSTMSIGQLENLAFEVAEEVKRLLASHSAVEPQITLEESFRNVTLRSPKRMLRKASKSPDLASGSANRNVRQKSSDPSHKRMRGKEKIEEKASLTTATLQNRKPLKESTNKTHGVPHGYRLTSTGTLIRTSTSKAPRLSTVIQSGRLQPVRETANDKVVRANPVPKWLRQRREQLEKEAEVRLREECEKLRAALVKTQPNERPAFKQTKSRPVLITATERRLQERAAWEAGRRHREEQLKKERNKIAQEREEAEEIAYRQDRQRAVVRANPLPAWLKSTRSTVG